MTDRRSLAFAKAPRMLASLARPLRRPRAFAGNDNQPHRGQDSVEAVARRFRELTAYLVVASSIIAAVLAVTLAVPVDPTGSFAIEWALASLLLASRIWCKRNGYERLADASGTIALVSLGAMSCGAIAMLELRLSMPMADGLLISMDDALGLDGLAVLRSLAEQKHWVFAILAPIYNLTVPLFFAGLGILTFRGERVEAWRTTFCFVGTLLTTCVIAALFPAKGLGVWAPPALLAHLPDQAMRTFWQHFDAFYYGADPVLRLQVVDGVISFPSFHAIVGFLVLTQWRRQPVTFAIAGCWLTLMLISTLPGGGHYFVDLLGGFAVWLAWFMLSRRIERSTLGATADGESATQA